MFAIGSIKWRLQAWHGVLLCAVTATLLVAYFRSEQREAIGRLDRENRMILMIAVPELRGLRPMPGPPPRAPDLGPSGSDDWDEGGRTGPARVPLLREHVRSGGFIAHAPPGRPLRTVMGDAPQAILDREVEGSGPSDTTYSAEGFRIVRHSRRVGETILVGAPLAPVEAALETLAWKLALAGIGTVLLGVVAGAWIIGRSLRPIDAIATTARRIADGAMSERVRVPERGGELAALAGVLNDCFERVERSFRQQARFTADASHELRTPLSVILTESQLALKKERGAADYRESLAICAETAGRMKRLVEDLLLLARADAQALQAAQAPCDLAEIAARTAEFLGALAEERGLRIETRLQPAPCRGDAAQLERVLVNVLMNALQHAPSGTTVVVETSCASRRAIASVTDTGPGITAEALPHVFDRFYRADPSRSRKEGGTGLGLAISKGIAEAHGGTLEAASEPGVRTTFALSLPSIVSS